LAYGSEWYLIDLRGETLTIKIHVREIKSRSIPNDILKEVRNLSKLIEKTFILTCIMLIKKNTYGYSQKKKYITGRGFVDALSSVFNSLKASAVPAIKSIGSYVSNNKDLIAKPLSSAVGSLAATGLTAGVPALISHIMNKIRNR